MCLIVYKPAGHKFDRAILKRAIADNPDGAGYFLRYRGELYSDKGLWSYPALVQKLKGLHHFEVALHFRYATHGCIKQTNCHPFFGKGWALVHNGVIPYFGSITSSDTKEFTRYLVDEYGADAPDMADDWKWLTGGSKFVIGTGDRPFTIVGEDNGQWHNGLWYSNRWSLLVEREEKQLRGMRRSEVGDVD